MTKISSLDESSEMKQCQKCHNEFPREDFYKRQDRNGEYKWKMSYCKKCSMLLCKEARKKNPEKFKEYNKKNFNKYYHENKDKVRIIQKRYYYNKLPPEKQVKYKHKVENTWPEWVEQICGK